MPSNVQTTQLQDLINVVNSSDVLIRMDPTFVTNGQPCTTLQVSDQIPYIVIHDCCTIVVKKFFERFCPKKTLKMLPRVMR